MADDTLSFIKSYANHIRYIAEGREVCLNNSTTIGSCQSGIWVESEDVKASGECTVSGVQCFSVPKITRPGAENLCVNLGELEELLKFLKVPGGVFGDEDGSEPGGSQSTTATSDEPTSTGEGTANQTPTATPSGTECTPASTTLSIPTPAPPSSTSSSSQTSATTTTTGADGKATVVISGPIETPVPADPASIPVATVTVTTTVGAPQTAAPTPA